jgi:hypothetical protein
MFKIQFKNSTGPISSLKCFKINLLILAKTYQKILKMKLNNLLEK